MATVQSPAERFAEQTTFPASQSRPVHSSSYINPVEENFALTDSQKEILSLLEEKPHAVVTTPVADAPGGFGLDVAFATVGAAAIVSGVALVFFFAALGSLLLVFGGILCAIAFERVALRDVQAQGADDAVKLGAEATP